MKQCEHHLETVSIDRWVARSIDVFAMAISTAIELRGRCVVGISGGNTPTAVFEGLAQRSMDWEHVVFVQVDERLAPLDSPDRNLTSQKITLGALPSRWIELPVDDALGADHGPGIADFEYQLRMEAGNPPVLDVVHLGLGNDGHTASLFSGDPAAQESDALAVVTARYNGLKRVTLTKPVLERARLAIWLVNGAEKSMALEKLVACDPSTSAGSLRLQRSIIVATP